MTANIYGWRSGHGNESDTIYRIYGMYIPFYESLWLDPYAVLYTLPGCLL